MNIKNIYKRKATCLYVEDDERLRFATLKVLEELFESVIVAEDGLDGYKKFFENNIDVVITDMSMPSDGSILISKIRERDKTVPIIVHTAHTEFKNIYKNIDYIYIMMKPLCLETFTEILVEVDIEILHHRKHIQSFKSLQKIQQEAKKVLELIWKDRQCNLTTKQL
jgi:DNA-binding NtrC family response regulator